MTRLFDSTATCYVMGRCAGGWMICAEPRHDDGLHRDGNGTCFRVNQFSNWAEIVAPELEG